MTIPAQKIIATNIVLLLVTTISFLISQTPLFSDYSFQFFSFIVILYILGQFIFSKFKNLKTDKMLFDFAIIACAIIFFISMTGYLASPLFFLLYFLIFGISLLLHPSAALTTAFTLSILLLITPKKDLVSELMQLSSLFLITPLALIFGTQYIKLQQEKDKAEILKKGERLLLEEVMDQEKKVRQWTQGEFKNHLIKIWENIDNLTKGVGLTDFQKTKLAEISNQLSNLLKSGEEMKKKIEK